MTVPGNIDALLLGGQRGYQVERSLRFNSPDSAYLNRTPASAGNRKTYTISMWIKRAKLGASSRLFGAYSSASAYFEAFFTSSDTLQWYYWNGSGYSYNRITSQVFRDPSAWCHLVFVFNSPSATGSQRIRIYFNGQEITTFSSSTDPSQNFDCVWNSTANNVIGDLLYGGSPGSTFDGLMAEVHHIDGQALAPSSFGETDIITGVWKPKRYSGTYGTNGFYLKFAQNSIGVDLTSTATLTAPFGGTAENARVSDSVYLISNTSTGSGFTFLQEDFGSVKQLSRYYIAAMYFTGGTSTFALQYSTDGSSWTTATSLSITASGQNISGDINVNARYVRLQATAFGSNGQAGIDSFLVYQDPLGVDSSPNGNNWNVNNFSIVAGAGNDSLIDTPTPYADGGNGRGNYATLNPLNSYSAGLSNGNLQLTQTASSWVQGNSTIGVSTGKWFWEVLFSSGTNIVNGITKSPLSSSYVGSTSDSWGWSGGGLIYTNGNSSSYGSSLSVGDIIGVALDLDAGTLTFYKNGVSQGQAASGLSGTFFPAISVYGSTSEDINFGQRAFAYTPPSGFLALNTQNLPEPSIKKPSSYIDVVLYTGTGSALTPTSSLGFSPDLVWIKSRSAATDHALYDAVRGTEKRLESNNTDAEVTSDGGVTAFNSAGFTLGTLAQVNTNTATYCAWCWDESATPGFDIVTYTGDGVAGRTVSHSLGVAPSMMFVKRRTTAGASWLVYHASAGSPPQNNFLILNATDAVDASSLPWNNTAPTSAVFTVGTSGGTNNNGDTFVAYLWSEVAGFSKFGSYTGNGSTDGPFVFCGFRPRWLLIKSSSVSGESWILEDSARDTYNPAAKWLYPNYADAESNGLTIDFLSNGFKPRISGTSVNTSSATYIFAAFAESPQKYSLAR